jgi:hypothetical protein
MPDDSCFLRMYTRFSAEANATTFAALAKMIATFVGGCATFVDLEE